MADTSIGSAAVLGALEQVLAGRAFQGAGRSGALLRFLIERTLAGQADQLKEYTVGAEALGRGAAFDPRSDSIVRVEVSRLRGRLDLYYATEGASDPVRILVPKGSYVPTFEMASPTSSGGSQSRIWKLTAAGAIAVAAVMAWSPWRERMPEPAAAIRVEMDLGEAVTIRSSQVGSSSVVISPDGRRLVFLSFRQQVPRLMTRVLDKIEGAQSIELPGTEGARGPFFSWDGRQVGFFAAGKLWRTRVDGGTPTSIAAAEELLGGSWGDDDFIVAALSTAGLVRVPAGGGTPEVISGAPPGARWPQVLPGSRAVLFTAGGTPVVAGALRVDVLSLADGKITTLVPGGSYARYLASGHLAWVDRRTLFVAPFSLDRLQLTGPGVAVIDDIALNMYNSAEFDASQTGTFVCRCGPGGDDSVVQWLDQSGTATPLLPEPAGYSGPRLSPDGSRIAFVMGRNGDRQDLRIVDLRSGKTDTLGGAGPSRPVWTPDGRFLVSVGASGEVRWMKTDGSAAAGTLVPSGDTIRIPWSFDDDGTHLAFYQRGTGGTGSVTFDLWTVPVTIGRDSMTAGKPEPFLVSDAFEVYPAFSPDGRWIAYTSLESGAYEIYVRAFPDKGHKRQVSTHGGTVAAWARDGRRLFYQTADQRIMVVDWSVSEGVSQPAQPRFWTDTRLADVGLAPSFDVAPDGRVAALMIPPRSASRRPANQVTLVLNLFTELRLRAPR